jgi:hypothetical protein
LAIDRAGDIRLPAPIPGLHIAGREPNRESASDCSVGLRVDINRVVAGEYLFYALARARHDVETAFFLPDAGCRAVGEFRIQVVGFHQYQGLRLAEKMPRN